MRQGEWHILSLIDAENLKHNRNFCIREFVPNKSEMGRNDLCFCGSEKKQKKCHPDIHEKSVIANLYSVFDLIEKEYTIPEHTYCCKGCSSCCSDFFNVSIVEFFMILQHLRIVSPYEIKIYSDKAKHIVEQYDLPEDDKFNIDNFTSCIFLDDVNGSCKIYEVRPTMCRLYGNTNLTRCPKIMQDKEFCKELIHLTDSKLIENVDQFHVKGQTIQPKVHPLVYWFSRIDDDGELKVQRMRDLFQASTERPIDDFVRILLI